LPPKMLMPTTVNAYVMATNRPEKWKERREMYASGCSTFRMRCEILNRRRNRSDAHTSKALAAPSGSRSRTPQRLAVMPTTFCAGVIASIAQRRGSK